MSKSERDIIVEQPINKVYAVAETYPMFVDFYLHKEVLSNSDIASRVKVSSKFFHLVEFFWEGTARKIKNEKIIWSQSKGLLKGMCATWSFFDMGGKTKVNLRVTYEPTIKIFRSCLGEIANLFFIKKTIPKILNSLKTACEK